MSGVMAEPVCWLVEDDQETVPNDFIHDKVEESQNLGIEAKSEPNVSAVHPSRDPCSKNSSVSEQTPVMSIEQPEVSQCHHQCHWSQSCPKS